MKSANKHAGHATLESMSQAQWYNRWTLNKFNQYLTGDILEVGCGIGNFTTALLAYGNVWAFDIEQRYKDLTDKRTRAKAKVGLGNIESGKYFFRKKSFDAIVCLNVLEHIKSDMKALKNMHSLTKPGGHLILLVPTHTWLYGSIDKALGHYRRYDKKSLNRKLKTVGYTVVYSRLQNMLGALGWFVSGKIACSTIVNETPLKLFDRIAPIALKLEEIVEPPFGTSVLVIARRDS